MSESLPGATTALRAEIEKLKAELKIELDMGNARVEGFEAFKAGVAQIDNPHTTYGPVGHIGDAWESGWLLAAGNAARTDLAAALKRSEEAEKVAGSGTLIMLTPLQQTAMHEERVAAIRERDEARSAVDEREKLRAAAWKECHSRGRRIAVLETALRDVAERAHLAYGPKDKRIVTDVIDAALSPNPAAGDEGTKR